MHHRPAAGPGADHPAGRGAHRGRRVLGGAGADRLARHGVRPAVAAAAAPGGGHRDPGHPAAAGQRRGHAARPGPGRQPAHRGRPGRPWRSTGCSATSRRPWAAARPARPGCAASPPTPATSCAPRWPPSAATPSSPCATPARSPPTSSTRCSRVESESERMSVLVDELLLLAQLDAGRPLAQRAGGPDPAGHRRHQRRPGRRQRPPLAPRTARTSRSWSAATSTGCTRCWPT